jgi:hypothetical protein
VECLEQVNELRLAEAIKSCYVGVEFVDHVLVLPRLYWTMFDADLRDRRPQSATGTEARECATSDTASPLPRTILLRHMVKNADKVHGGDMVAIRPATSPVELEHFWKIISVMWVLDGRSGEI